ncbi:hypothetical protein EDB84DRAFT_1640459 [Lactarius hengduanensis]|nr:hypothetical protein EDB84DRAFT_1640459 [Lactarius hengduanensis]
MDLGHDTRATQVLQSAEEQEVTIEQSIKCPRAPHFPGKSERTLSREKLAWRKLAAQGFTTLPDFFRQKAEKEDRQARLDALVAAAVTWHRFMQRRQEEEEEEEEEEEVVPCVSKLTSEPIQVDDTAGVQPMPSPLKRIPLPVEESEESGSSCKTLSDDKSDEPNSESDTGSPPSKKMRLDLNNIVCKLEELRRGMANDPDNSSPKLHAQDYLRDCAMDPILHGHIQAMAGTLNLFVDEDLGYTWRQASLIFAKSQNCGVSRARSIRQWVLIFLQSRDLPLHKYNWTRSTVLGDEDISQEVQFELGEMMKNRSIKAIDLVNVIASPKMQEQFKQAGVNKPSISERTAHDWLGSLGWRYGKQQNGMYIDGHEREDVVQYRSSFVQRFKQHERRFHLWDDNGEELPRPCGFLVPEAARSAG